MRRRIGQHRRIGGEKIGVLFNDRHQRRAARRLQIARHLFIPREDRRRRAKLRPHIGDGRLAGRADGRRTRADIFDNRVGATGNAKLPRHPQDDVLGRGPAAKFSGQINRDTLWIQQFPRQTGNYLDRVRAADTHGTGAKPARIGRMRIRGDDHRAGKSIILQHDLMDDPGARPPETRAIACGSRAEKIIDLFVLGQRLR